MPGEEATAVPMRRETCTIAAIANPTYKGEPEYTGAWKDCAYDPELPGPRYHPGAAIMPVPHSQHVHEP